LNENIVGLLKEKEKELVVGMENRGEIRSQDSLGKEYEELNLVLLEQENTVN
jgi:hypothetical protein